MEKKRQQKTGGHKKKWLCLAAGALLLVGLSAWLVGREEPFPSLQVGAHSVSREAYDWALSQARKDVLSQHAAAGIALTDWTEENDLGIPYQLAADRAVELLKEYYAVSTLAVERGYLNDSSFEAAAQAREEYNRQRRQTLESGGIVTGITAFTLPQFINYRVSALRRQFTSDDTNPEMTVTQVDIQERYEQDKDALYQAQDTLSLGVIVLDPQPEELEELRQELEELRQNTLEQGSLAEAAQGSDAFRELYQQLDISNSNYAAYARSHADVLTWSENLQAGEISQVYSVEGRLCLIQCLSRDPQSYVALESVASVVTQVIREDRYDALVKQRAGAMEATGDWEALRRYCAGQLS